MTESPTTARDPASAPRNDGTSATPGTPGRPGRPSRRATLGFYTAVTVGLLTGFVLWVHAVVDQPPVRLAKPRVQQEATGARVQTLARNHSSVAYCVAVEMQADDRDGRTLEKVVATSSSGEVIRPNQTVNFVGVFSQMTEEEIDEKLDEYVAYITRREKC
jgi:hypothetical protein